MSMVDEIRNLIESNLDVFDDEAVFGNDDNFFKMGFVNSMFAMKIINFIESQYNISVPDKDLDINNFNSVNKIVSYVNKMQKN